MTAAHRVCASGNKFYLRVPTRLSRASSCQPVKIHSSQWPHSPAGQSRSHLMVSWRSRQSWRRAWLCCPEIKACSGAQNISPALHRLPPPAHVDTREQKLKICRGKNTCIYDPERDMVWHSPFRLHVCSSLLGVIRKPPRATALWVFPLPCMSSPSSSPFHSPVTPRFHTFCAADRSRASNNHLIVTLSHLCRPLSLKWNLCLSDTLQFTHFVTFHELHTKRYCSENFIWEAATSLFKLVQPERSVCEEE